MPPEFEELLTKLRAGIIASVEQVARLTAELEVAHVEITELKKRIAELEGPVVSPPPAPAPSQKVEIKQQLADRVIFSLPTNVTGLKMRNLLTMAETMIEPGQTEYTVMRSAINFDVQFRRHMATGWQSWDERITITPAGPVVSPPPAPPPPPPVYPVPANKFHLGSNGYRWRPAEANYRKIVLDKPGSRQIHLAPDESLHIIAAPGVRLESTNINVIGGKHVLAQGLDIRNGRFHPAGFTGRCLLQDCLTDRAGTPEDAFPWIGGGYDAEFLMDNCIATGITGTQKGKHGDGAQHWQRSRVRRAGFNRFLVYTDFQAFMIAGCTREEWDNPHPDRAVSGTQVYIGECALSNVAMHYITPDKPDNTMLFLYRTWDPAGPDGGRRHEFPTYLANVIIHEPPGKRAESDCVIPQAGMKTNGHPSGPYRVVLGGRDYLMWPDGCNTFGRMEITKMAETRPERLNMLPVGINSRRPSDAEYFTDDNWTLAA